MHQLPLSLNGYTMPQPVGVPPTAEDGYILVKEWLDNTYRTVINAPPWLFDATDRVNLSDRLNECGDLLQALLDAIIPDDPMHSLNYYKGREQSLELQLDECNQEMIGQMEEIREDIKELIDDRLELLHSRI